MNILLIDNYDSFTYNIVGLLKQLNYPLTIRKNDDPTLLDADSFTHCILSPGPSLPQDAGKILEFIQRHYRTLPILGICLGHQAIAQAFGAGLEVLAQPRHGKQCEVYPCANSLLLQSIPFPFKAGLYHSWQIARDHFPDELRITSHSLSGDILSIEHRQYPVYGIQFHPESYMSEYGLKILQNFINIV